MKECDLCDRNPKYLVASCSVSNVFDLIGSKWILPILLELEVRKNIRFNELQKILAPISAKILSKRLKTLVDQGFAQRNVTSTMPVPKTEYNLTKKGKEFMECVLPVLEFGEKYDNQLCKVTRQFKDGLIIAQPKYKCLEHSH